MINKKSLHSLLIAVILFILVSAGVAAWKLTQPKHGPPLPATAQGIRAFTSPEEFNAYLAQASSFSQTTFGTAEQQKSVAGSPVDLAAPVANQTGTRVSTTNIQVPGIDEPDILKTDGQHLFLSTETQYFYNLEKILPTGELTPATGGGSAGSATTTAPDAATLDTTVPPTPAKPIIVPPEPVQSTTKIINAVPADALSLASTLDDSGNLLLDQNALVVFAGQKIVGYDVSDPAKPAKHWTDQLGQNTSLVAARLRQGKVYAVTQTFVQRGQPCPLTAIAVDSRAMPIPCGNIYHPVAPTAADTTMTVMVIDPSNGQIEKQISFLGTSSTTVVYMSDQALYVTASVYADPTAFEYAFLTTAAQDLLPPSVVAKIRRLQTYDISKQAQLVELQWLLSQWQSSLSEKDLQAVQKTLDQRRQDFQAQHLRELETTTIVKIGVPNLQVAATGSVPGHVLNQFALDEFQGVLRVATTSNGGWFGGVAKTVNDLYTLGPDLKIRGQVVGLGQGEQIYAARFIGALGYLVTFKQTDPFFVIDLSNAAQPKLVGELKIPGFSSYLHPLGNNLVIGVGQENAQTKVSLFDVSNPAQPAEVSKLLLNDGWSQVQSNHHAFLLDTKHQIFFLPAGANGEIISYANRQLTKAATVADLQANRAVYINDDLYVIGQDAIKVLDENSWTELKELAL